jgi:hypothetical protein
MVLFICLFDSVEGKIGRNGLEGKKEECHGTEVCSNFLVAWRKRPSFLRENSLFGTETNDSSVFGTENFELPYLASI